MRQRLGWTIVLLAMAWTAVRADDADLLKKANVGVSDKELVDFFRSRTLDDAELRKLEAEGDRLLNGDVNERDAARDAFKKAGRPSYGILRSLAERAGEKQKPVLDNLRSAIEKESPKNDPGSNFDVVLPAARLLLKRNIPAAEATLLAYLPSCADEFDDDLLAMLVPRLALRSMRETVEAEKLPLRRGLLLYGAARYLGPDERAWILPYGKDDAMRRRVVEGFMGRAAVRSREEARDGDLVALKAHSAKLAPPLAAALVEFFQKRTRSPEELARIHSWLSDLGNVEFRIREDATRQLSLQGPLILPFLREYETDNDPEVLRRATLIHDRIRNGPGPELTIAALRQLAESSTPPAEALAVLVAFAPFADNDQVADETYAALVVEAIRMGGGPAAIEPLTQATRDSQPGRRAAAAWVLGMLGTGEQIAAVRNLRTDADNLVRLRAAQGLVASGDRDAVLTLIEMLPTVAGALSASVEETLQTLAGERVPTIPMTDDSAAGRAKLRDAWKGWWTSNRDTVDMSLLRRGLAFQGLITICEYDGGVPGRGSGRVWQRGRDGRTRWTLEGFRGGMYAQALPGNRVLVAENMANTVVEKDQQNVTIWEYQTPTNPIACQRLPNGNTFIATYNQVMEITPDKKQVFLTNVAPGFHLFSAERTREGKIVCMTAQGDLLELDGSNGKEIRRFRAVQAGGWCSAQALPNGRYLIATMSVNGGQIVEVDDKGAKHWSANYAGAFRAYRLPTGNTIVVSMTTRKVAELDREGHIRWETTCIGRPWSVQVR
jgi:hypothetical protein